MSRRIIAVAVVSLVAAGCGDFGADERGTSMDGPDSMPPPGSIDAGAGIGDAAPLEPGRLDERQGIPVDEDGFATDSRSENGGGPASCYDGELAGGDDALADCADPACGGLASCCVGTGSELCCVDLRDESPLPQTLVFDDTCAGDPTTSCLAGQPVESFGTPRPWVRSGMLHPGGDTSYDSGLAIGGELDLTAMRVSVTTTIALPTDACTEGCLEGAGVALTAQGSFGDNMLVQPLAALFASGARREVTLLVGDVVVHRWSSVVSGATWTLTARPTGEIDVLYDDPAVAADETVTAPFPTSDRARLVVYGRNRNQSAIPDVGASFGSIDMTASVCDMPSAWRDRSGLLIRPSGTAAPIDSATLRGASIAWDPGAARDVLVYQDGEDFYLAARGGDDVTFIQMLDGAPALQTDRDHEEGGIADPDLVITETERVLFYTAADLSGRRTIGRATEDTTMGPWVLRSDELPFLEPSGDEVGLSMPSVATHPSMSNVWIMALRADLVDGSHELRLYVSYDAGETFGSFADLSDLGTVTSRGIASRPGFDADEVAAPSLVIHRGAYHLYYAGREGTRWNIGMLSSDELVFWRDPLGSSMTERAAPVLAADGNGADRLSVRDPEANPRGSVMELLYTGHDGARDSLFRAWRLSGEEPSP